MNKILLLTALMWQVCVVAQPTIEWQKLLGGTNYEIALCTTNAYGGGFITVGRSYSNNDDLIGAHGDADAWIVRTSATGSVLWTKAIGGSGFDNAKTIKQTTDGGYIIGGESGSTDGDVTGTSYGSDDFWLVKIDANANIQWQHRYGGMNFDDLGNVSQTPDGGYIMAGQSAYGGGMVTTYLGNDDAWIVKVNADGVYQWQKTLGGSGNDGATDILALNDGNYMVAGYTNSTDGNVASLHGFYDFWVVKLNANGTIIWEKTYGGTDMEIANTIRPTADGGFVLAGRTSSNNDQVSGNHALDPGNIFYGPDMWVIKIDPNGNLQWQKCLGGFANEEAWSIEQTNDGGYIVAGGTDTPPNQDGDVTDGSNGGEDMWIIKLDAAANLQWNRTFGSGTTDTAFNVIQSPDGGYVLTGYAGGEGGNVPPMQQNHISDFWIIKLAADNLSTNTFDTRNAVVYPNPASDIIHVELQNGQQIENISIADALGKIVIEQSDANKVDVSQLSKGLYLITVGNSGGAQTLKFIKN